MRLVFRQWQFTVQIVLTTSSKTVADRKSARVPFNAQWRRAGWPRQSPRTRKSLHRL